MTIRTKYVSKPLNINPNFNPFNPNTEPLKQDNRDINYEKIKGALVF
jgi:hypothetical protein